MSENTVVRTRRPLYREMAAVLRAIKNCEEAAERAGEPHPWLERHEETLKRLVSELPSGGGIDVRPSLVREDCREDRLVLTFSYHHMNENGMYDGWTDHVLYVTPSFDGIDLRITGRNRNDIKDYLYECFNYALTQEIEIG